MTAGSLDAWKKLVDAGEAGKTNELGVSMVLFDEFWYVNAGEVNLERAMVVPKFRFSILEFLMLTVAFVIIAYYYLGRVNDWPLRPAAISGLFLGLIMISWDAALRRWRTRPRE